MGLFLTEVCLARPGLDSRGRSSYGDNGRTCELRVSINTYLLKYDNAPSFILNRERYWEVLWQGFDLFTIIVLLYSLFGNSLPTNDFLVITLRDLLKADDIECRRSVPSARSRCILPKS